MNQLTQSDIKLLLARWGSWSRDGGTIVVGYGKFKNWCVNGVKPN